VLVTSLTGLAILSYPVQTILSLERVGLRSVATVYFELVVRANPTSERWVSAYYDHMRGRRQLERSAALLGELAEHHPNDRVVQLYRGLILTDVGRWEEAVEAYGRGGEANPREWVFRNNRGLLLGRLGRTEEGLADLERALAIVPEDVYPVMNRALVLAWDGQKDRAWRIATDAASIFLADGPHRMYWFKRACVAVATDRPDDAWFALDRLVESGFRGRRRLRGEPILEPLRGDPRWKAVMEGVRNNIREERRRIRGHRSGQSP